MCKLKIDNVADYLKEIKRLSESVYNDEAGCDFWQNEAYYRGQADEDWSLVPTIMRPNSDGIDLVSREHKLLQEARNALWNEISDCKNHLEMLIRFQHYGLPTRLLDVTTNPLVALYFACISDNEKNGIVYIGHNTGTNNTVVKQITSYLFENIDSDPVDTRYFDAGSNLSSPYYIYPPMNNPRIVAQNGAFLMAPLVEKRGDILTLCRSYIFKNVFEKGLIIIPKEAKKNILDELDRCGINEASLFPDMEHKLRHIKNSVINQTLKVAPDTNKGKCL